MNFDDLKRIFFAEIEDCIAKIIKSDPFVELSETKIIPLVERNGDLCQLPNGESFPIHQYYGYIEFPELLNVVSGEDIEKAIYKLGHQVIGIYISQMRHSVRKYGKDCFIVGWKDVNNLQLNFNDWEHFSSVSFNFKTGSCPNRYK